ncbi:MGH1-like glycoside hydrolase domain-containing protein [Silvibacterium acidisoli]|uniref:MGH1-like glycoside hydrolase domain-containing protein n=1 Tax=Acidobacteriaceae bacterium ZG23-2 TaxID=2883246 RepID=UPI00406C22B6
MQERTIRRCLLSFSLIAVFASSAAAAEEAKLPSIGVDAGQHFVAAHGQRAIVMGYPAQGLEMWAYPLQLVSGYRVGFLSNGASSEVDGRLLLKRVITEPDSVTRIYAGPSYIVREKLFVPVSEPVAILSYEVESAEPVSIVVHFQPVLDLMWPAAVGGQSASWRSALNGYFMEEPTHRFAALVASPEAAEHDETGNSTVRVDQSLAFTLHPRQAGKHNLATVFVGTVPASHPGVMKAWQQKEDGWLAEAGNHYKQLAANAIQLETPDEQLNSAFAWAEIALDQAWVCNDKLGCGEIAGYGPSRPGRRPQYDWFFAGDGMIAAEGFIAAGEYARARQELEFIQKYQDPKTGMIWHELSQSAGYIDWSAYPYMYVHVDLSFDYLNAIEHYVTVSGDKAFAQEHWQSIAAAYRYCQSIIHEKDHLPHIPSDKEGGDEQHRPDDDLNLSTSWISAAHSFASLAQLTGHPSEAADATHAEQLARQSFATRYWDQSAGTWVDGHTAAGDPILNRHSGAMSAIVSGDFVPQQARQALEQLASASYQTDWGTRSASTHSPIFDPWSYATGSVSAAHSAGIAGGFWSEGYPITAWSILDGLLSWNTLDSPGHLHEVLAGNFYREQSESVPEQTWSSAALVSATMDGLLGVKASGDTLVLRPALPADWHQVTVKHLPLAGNTATAILAQDESSVGLRLSHSGPAVHLDYAPALPLGAELDGAECDGHPQHATLETMPQATYAHLNVETAGSLTECRIRFHGGVAILQNAPAPQLGDASVGIKIKTTHLEGGDLTITADVHTDGDHTFRILTPWKIGSTDATVQPLGGDLYRITIAKATGSETKDSYAAVAIHLHLAKR